MAAPGPNNDEVAIGLGEGGLLRRVERRCHLTALGAQLAAIVAITWVPILALGFVSEHGYGRRVALLHDPAVHVRLVIATPVLLYLDLRFPRACRYALDQLSRFGFVPPARQADLARTIDHARRLSNWWLPEALLALGAIGLGVAALLGAVTVSGVGPGAGASPTQLWYAVVALPLFEFLLLRALWRWVIWVSVLAGMARIDLDLDPAHPDRRGGLSFLSLPSLDYCAMLLFAASSVLCAEWGTRVPVEATLGSFVPLLLGFAGFGVLVAFGPLLLFMPQLLRARRAGLFLIGGMAARAGQAFRRDWLLRPGAAVPDKDELERLVAIADTYRGSVERFRIIAFGRRDLLIVLIATLAPVAPLMLLHVPRSDWLAFASLFFGGPIP